MRILLLYVVVLAPIFELKKYTHLTSLAQLGL